MPDILDPAQMGDDELNRRFSGLERYVARARGDSSPNFDAEVDLCYLYRELEMRNVRRERHVVYLANHARDES